MKPKTRVRPHLFVPGPDNERDRNGRGCIPYSRYGKVSAEGREGR